MKHFTPLEILSAYTGVLMCKFSRMHEYIEVVFGGPVFTHEMGDRLFFAKLAEKIKERGDFDKAVNLIESAFPTPQEVRAE